MFLLPKGNVNLPSSSKEGNSIKEGKGYSFKFILENNKRILDCKIDNFLNNKPYAYIPVSVYRNIELAIKENVQEVLTDEGRKLNFIYWWTTVVPK